MVVMQPAAGDTALSHCRSALSFSTDPTCMRSQAGKGKRGCVHEILSPKGMAQPEPSEDRRTI